MITRDVAPWLALDPPAAARARWLTEELLVNLFVPVVDGAPAWLRPGPSGLVGVTTAGTARTRPLLERRGGHLVLSGANRTGGEVAVTALEADAAFDGALLVLDGDDERDPRVPCGSAAIVVVHPHGGLELARRGIQTVGRDAAAFLEELACR